MPNSKFWTVFFGIYRILAIYHMIIDAILYIVYLIGNIIDPFIIGLVFAEQLFAIFMVEIIPAISGTPR